ncbi:4'-phosphopantetheinyl transferase family protein [Eionea flava]
MSKPLDPLLSSMTLKPNEVHLWVINEYDALVANMFDVYLSLLSPNELHRLSGFSSEQRKQQYQTTYAALKSITSAYIPVASRDNIQFVADRFGKPRLIDESIPLQFNLSHSEGRIVIGFAAQQAIGIDIEKIQARRNMRAIAERYFHSDEWENQVQQDALGAERYFYKLWVLKEAFIKAEGKGFAIPLHQFYFDFSKMDAPELVQLSSKRYSKKKWIFQHRFLESNYSLAFALEAIENNSKIKVVVRQYIPHYSVSIMNNFSSKK